MVESARQGAADVNWCATVLVLDDLSWLSADDGKTRMGVYLWSGMEKYFGCPNKVPCTTVTQS